MAAVEHGGIMTSRGAIIVGVDRTGGNLPKLKGAAADAERVDAWLRGEGFDTVLLTDTKAGRRSTGAVSLAAIGGAVRQFVEKGTLDHLVIYFAGHGLNNFGTEIWLLSAAPDDPNEAISLSSNSDLARDCGIRTVTFISDACRSNPPAGPLRRVAGGAIFPNLRARPGPRGRVDRLLPTAPNAAAFEVDEEISEVVQRAGIFTTELLAAHGYPKKLPPQINEPEVALVRHVKGTAGVLRVVNLSQLGAHLEQHVPIAASKKKIEWPQQPECIVETPPVDKHIGRALFPPPEPDTSIAQNEAVGERRGELRPAAERDPESSRLKRDIALRVDRSKALIRRADQKGHFETHTGIQVDGAVVLWAHGVGVDTEILGGSQRSHLTRIHPVQRAGSVVLQFNGGTGTVIGAFDGYIASIKVKQGRVANISYIPSDLHQRWLSEPDRWTELGELRAGVAAKVKHGVFRITDEEPARFGDRIRTMKAVDPTLGIYASYAYHEVGRQNLVRSVARYMRNDLDGYLPFDVALLLGGRSKKFKGRFDLAAPFCPMLMQGWPLLKNRFADVPPNLVGLMDHLVPALWTTIDPDGMRGLKSELEARAKQ
ncbi:caspase family protein [Aquibium sp. ELW1220]|uniref:caspase family protein n=1 Tax=Aquibium sp. ELW1220 TaxID=2976766 RepID=UPI0025B19FCE|nr:caspase family protein [Aquibium sp. ELW1220]MDN2584301.1 caspase family protein [Aquibium sp. ELW1220]